MAIPVIPPLSSIAPASSSSAVAAAPTTGDGFGNQIANAVDSLQTTQSTAAADEAQTAAGEGNLADTMIAASQASLETQVTTALLDKAVSSYNDIMNMSF